MIFFLFKPLNIKEQEFIDVPLFEIKKFTLYELNTKGLKTFMSGETSLKYADRYQVKKIDFTDNSKNYISNMRADNGLYKDEKVYLDGNVSYVREDGLSFESQHVIYDKATAIVSSNDKYIAFWGKDRMKGSSIEYNTVTNKIVSKKIEIKYDLQESKK